ncbi:MAG: hypothetical protein IJ071_03965 [Ruminococcus sp.]|nr:hypothetical protein [Ruminococcus sp.]
MKGINIAGALAGAALACGLAAVIPFAARAATPDEAAAVARSYGYSEEDIQQAYNEYYENPELYPPEKIDEYIAKLHEAHQKQVSVVPQQTSVVIPSLTTTAAPAASAEDPDTPVTPAPVDDGSFTLTASDGSAFTRISREKFIALSYEEKLAYLSTFTEAQQQAIIDDLSPAENRSLLKQLPADKKVEVVDKLSEITDDMGMTITVEEISDDTLKIAMKNDKGELVNISEAGASVEKTGYDRRGILAFCGSLFIAAAAGIAVVMRKCFGREGNGEANE